MEDSSNVPIPFPKLLSFSFSNPALQKPAVCDLDPKFSQVKRVGSKVKRLSTRKSKSGCVFLGEISGVSSLSKHSSSSQPLRSRRSQMATSTVSVASKSAGCSEVAESRPGSPLPSTVLSASVESSPCKEGDLSGMKVGRRRIRILSITDDDSNDGSHVSPISFPSLRTVSAMVHSSNIGGELSDPEISFRTTSTKPKDVDVDATASTLAAANLASRTEDSTSQDVCMISSDYYDSGTSKERSPRFSRFVSARDDFRARQKDSTSSKSVMSVTSSGPVAFSQVFGNLRSAQSRSFSLLIPSTTAQDSDSVRSTPDSPLPFPLTCPSTSLPAATEAMRDSQPTVSSHSIHEQATQSFKPSPPQPMEHVQETADSTEDDCKYIVFLFHFTFYYIQKQ